MCLALSLFKIFMTALKIQTLFACRVQILVKINIAHTQAQQ
jgi:hypothetical protein